MTTHGSPELDEDARKLRALAADPGPTFEDLIAASDRSQSTTRARVIYSASCFFVFGLGVGYAIAHLASWPFITPATLIIGAALGMRSCEPSWSALWANLK